MVREEEEVKEHIVREEEEVKGNMVREEDEVLETQESKEQKGKGSDIEEGNSENKGPLNTVFVEGDLRRAA